MSPVSLTQLTYPLLGIDGIPPPTDRTLTTIATLARTHLPPEISPHPSSKRAITVREEKLDSVLEKISMQNLRAARFQLIDLASYSSRDPAVATLLALIDAFEPGKVIHRKTCDTIDRDSLLPESWKLTLKALVLYRLGQIVLAHDHISKAISKGARFGLTYYLRATIGQSNNAPIATICDDLEKACLQSPENRAWMRENACFAFSSHRYETALRNWGSFEPEELTLDEHLDAITAQYRLGRFRRAIADTQQLFATYPISRHTGAIRAPQLQFLPYPISTKNSALVTLTQQLLSTISFDAKNSEDCYSLLGRISLLEQNWEQALRFYQKVTAHNPRNASGEMGSSVALWRLGRQDEAKETLRQFHCQYIDSSQLECDPIGDFALQLLQNFDLLVRPLCQREDALWAIQRFIDPQNESYGLRRETILKAAASFGKILSQQQSYHYFVLQLPSSYKPKGFIHYTISHEQCHVKVVGSNNNDQGQLLSSYLFQFAIERAVKESCNAVIINCATYDLAFFIENGFKPMDYEKKEFGSWKAKTDSEKKELIGGIFAHSPLILDLKKLGNISRFYANTQVISS